MDTMRHRSAQEALNVLSRLGFSPNRTQAVRGGGMMGQEICFVHDETGTEIVLSMDAWQVLAPFFEAREADSAMRFERLRLAAEAALQVLEERVRPDIEAAKALRQSLE